LVGEQEGAFQAFSEIPRVTRVHNLIEAVNFDAQTVQVTGMLLQYDFLVIATGMVAPPAFRFGNRKTSASSRKDLMMSMDSFRESVFSASEVAERMRKSRKVLAAASVVVVRGSDSWAVEQACAIREAFPESKRVVLAAGDARLMPELLSEADSARLAARLKARRISVVLGDCTENVESQLGAAVLDCTSSDAPNTEYLPASYLAEGGFVDCDERLRVAAASLGNVFAAGQLVAGQRGDVVLAQHPSVVARNIAAMLSGRTPSAEVGKGPLLKLRKGVAVALGSKEFFSVGISGKLESVKRRRSPRDQH
jgi:hypothetical protein